MSTDSPTQSDSVSEVAKLPRDGWIGGLYRLQLWVFLLWGIYSLLTMLPLIWDWILGSPSGTLYIFIEIMLSEALYYFVFILVSVIALRNKSAFGWWLHFLSILSVPLFVLIPFVRFGISPDLGLIFGLSLLSLVSLSIAFAAKRSLFGSIGIVAPLLVILVISFSAFYIYPLRIEATIAFIAELQPVAEVQGKVVFANPQIEQSLRYSNRSIINLPDLPSKEYYQSYVDAMRARHDNEPLNIPDGQYYQVWLTDAEHSIYYPIEGFMVNDGSASQEIGPGFIAYDRAYETLKLEDFPVVLLSRETLSIAEINALVAKAENGRKQAEPTNVIFEGLFKKVDKTTQELYNSIVINAEDRIYLGK